MSQGERRHHYREIVGEDRAMAAASALVRESAWCEITPFPGDRWRFAVKIDRAATLDHIAERVRSIPVG
jgi:hypothetical protein